MWKMQTFPNCCKEMPFEGVGFVGGYLHVATLLKIQQ